MPTYEEVTPSIAASATDDDVLSDRQYQTSNNERTLNGVAAAVLDNSPANGDLIVEVFVGVLRVSEFRAGLVRTTGRELQADDYLPIGFPVPANAKVNVKIQNVDAGAAHTALLGVSFTGF